MPAVVAVSSTIAGSTVVAESPPETVPPLAGFAAAPVAVSAFVAIPSSGSVPALVAQSPASPTGAVRTVVAQSSPVSLLAIVAVSSFVAICPFEASGTGSTLASIRISSFVAFSSGKAQLLATKKQWRSFLLFLFLKELGIVCMIVWQWFGSFWFGRWIRGHIQGNGPKDLQPCSSRFYRKYFRAQHFVQLCQEGTSQYRI